MFGKVEMKKSEICVAYSFPDIHQIMRAALDPAYDSPLPMPYANVVRLSSIFYVSVDATNCILSCNEDDDQMTRSNPIHTR